MNEIVLNILTFISVCLALYLLIRLYKQDKELKK